jgi:hypothetical protein
MAKAGGKYREAPALVCRRGRYYVCRAFEQPVRLQGRFVNLLAADLPVPEQVEVPPGEVGLYYDVRDLCAGPPKLLYSSSYIGLKRESADETAWYAAGAAGTIGTAILFAGGRQPAKVEALGALGEPVAVSVERDREVLRLQYETDHRGMGLRVQW